MFNECVGGDVWVGYLYSLPVIAFFQLFHDYQGKGCLKSFNEMTRETLSPWVL
jgi:hypothetical protein